jgi:hypothetical protein
MDSDVRSQSTRREKCRPYDQTGPAPGVNGRCEDELRGRRGLGNNRGGRDRTRVAGSMAESVGTSLAGFTDPTAGDNVLGRRYLNSPVFMRP